MDSSGVFVFFAFAMLLLILIRDILTRVFVQKRASELLYPNPVLWQENSRNISVFLFSSRFAAPNPAAFSYRFRFSRALCRKNGPGRPPGVPFRISIRFP